MRVDTRVVEYSKVLKEIFSREVGAFEANEETVGPVRARVVAKPEHKRAWAVVYVWNDANQAEVSVFTSKRRLLARSQ